MVSGHLDHGEDVRARDRDRATGRQRHEGANLPHCSNGLGQFGRRVRISHHCGDASLPVHATGLDLVSDGL
jgi:hypothetical protein